MIQLAGLTAGTVHAVIRISDALLPYRIEINEALNPRCATARPSATPPHSGQRTQPTSLRRWWGR